MECVRAATSAIAAAPAVQYWERGTTSRRPEGPARRRLKRTIVQAQYGGPDELHNVRSHAPGDAELPRGGSLNRRAFVNAAVAAALGTASACVLDPAPAYSEDVRPKRENLSIEDVKVGDACSGGQHLLWSI